MTHFANTTILTHDGVMTMLKSAVSKAEEINCPQCIVIVDASGETMGEIRMTGAKFLSRKSALAKARTSASTRGPSRNVPENFRMNIGLATKGEVTGLTGGLPIVKNGHVIGAIGVGSGTGEQDEIVAIAALEAIGAEI